MIDAARRAQLLRFLVSGGTGFVLYYLFALALREWTTLGVGTSALLATLLAIPPTFLLQRSFTFRSTGRVHLQMAGYLALQLASALVISTGALVAARGGIPESIGFILAGIAGVVFTYLVQATIIFRKRGHGRPMSKTNAQYNVAAPGSLPVRLAARMRRVMYNSFLRLQQPGEGDTILDVGATSDQTYEASNYLEAWYPHKARVTAVGIDDASFLEQRYPGMTFVRADGRDLPFPDASFDIVHSSAVLEHVGSRAQQRRFIAELLRVARRGVFLTTPNRWFPVEFHSVLPLVHWLPAPAFRATLRALGHDELAREEHLNLLDAREVRALCEGLPCSVEVEAPRLFGWPSNIVCSLRRTPD